MCHEDIALSQPTNASTTPNQDRITNRVSEESTKDVDSTKRKRCKKMAETSDSDDAAQTKVESVEKADDRVTTDFNFDQDPENPYNWPKWRKNIQLAATAIVAFAGCVSHDYQLDYRPHFTDVNWLIQISWNVHYQPGTSTAH